MFNRISVLLFIAVLAVLPTARAQVTATYYSMDFGENFPHAFVHLTGTRDDGTSVNKYLGFSALNVTPAILVSSVSGEVIRRTPRYIDVSEPRFALVLSDEQFAAINSVADYWEDNKLSYDLNQRNCIHFVADTLHAIGLTVNWESEFFKKPKGFLREVGRLNVGYVIDLEDAPSSYAKAAHGLD